MTEKNLSNLIINKVHSVSTLYNPAGTKGKRDNRQRWAIVIKYEGETVYISCGKRFFSDINHIVMLPKGCEYEWQCTRTGHFCIIEFECDVVGSEPIVFSVQGGEKILKMIKELEYKRNIKGDLTDLISVRDTYSLIIALAEAEAKRYLPSKKHSKIAPALEYISRHYNESISNDGLAALVGTSTVYFRKLFTSIMGVSPIAYARKMRIEKAKEMLRSDYGTLSDIALSLGYPSLYDFSRDFKKHTGASPSKYNF